MGKRKAPEDLNNPNSDLCEFLIELSNYEKNVTKNIYKANAYRKAANTLSHLPTRVKSGKEAKALPGIGEKISKKIDEFLETGKLEKLENIRQDKDSVAINLLTRVSGIGPSKAKELVDNGIKTLEQLREIKDELSHHIQLGIKYFDDFEKKIPREEITAIEKFIRDTVNEQYPNIVITICGSYRRGKSESGDIDVLITDPNYTSSKAGETKKNTTPILRNVVECLKKKKFITDTLSEGKVKFMGVCRLPDEDSKPFRRLDIRLVPHDQYYCAILYFTGSDLFNRDMRAQASEKKYILNEYSLRRLMPGGSPGDPEKITCEEDIFKILGMKYIEPKDRNM